MDGRRTGILAVCELGNDAHLFAARKRYIAPPVHLPLLPLYIPVCVSPGDILRRINRVSDRHVTRMMTRADGNSKRVYRQYAFVCVFVATLTSLADETVAQLFRELSYKVVTSSKMR